MKKIFNADKFEFPYDSYRFPGQASDEKILFITRENQAILWLRRSAVLIVGLAVLLAGVWLSNLLQRTFDETFSDVIIPVSSLVAILIVFVGWWWITSLWRKSLAFVTTKRLAKIVYSTPFTRHTLSLPLEMIVDTGAYTKGVFSAIFKLGTFTARSSAASSGVATDDIDRVNKKYFYLENISEAEDLQHYVNKLLNVFRNKKNKLENFRPFIPQLKADKRQDFMKKYPQYWS